MSKDSNSRKQLQLVTVMTGVMVPIITLLAIVESYYLLGVAILIELVLIFRSAMLVKSSGQNNPPTSQGVD